MLSDKARNSKDIREIENFASMNFMRTLGKDYGFNTRDVFSLRPIPKSVKTVVQLLKHFPNLSDEQLNQVFIFTEGMNYIIRYNLSVADKKLEKKAECFRLSQQQEYKAYIFVANKSSFKKVQYRSHEQIVLDLSKEDTRILSIEQTYRTSYSYYRNGYYFDITYKLGNGRIIKNNNAYIPIFYQKDISTLTDKSGYITLFRQEKLKQKASSKKYKKLLDELMETKQGKDFKELMQKVYDLSVKVSGEYKDSYFLTGTITSSETQAIASTVNSCMTTLSNARIRINNILKSTYTLNELAYASALGQMKKRLSSTNSTLRRNIAWLERNDSYWKRRSLEDILL